MKSIAVLKVSKKGDILEVDKASNLMFNKDSSEFVGKPIVTIFNEASRNHFKEVFDKYAVRFLSFYLLPAFFLSFFFSITLPDKEMPQVFLENMA